jgi:hypothetical protein
MRHLLILCSFVFVVGSPALAWQHTGKKSSTKNDVRSSLSNPATGIAESHIKGNVPAKPTFDKYLKRDLAAYFAKSTGKKVAVEYEFLRDGPTQTGISYPKYYLWVKARTGKQISDEGAMRVAAIDQQRFEVTHFLPKAAMKKDAGQINAVFPLPVGDRIRQRLK